MSAIQGKVFASVYDALVAKAVKLDVCPKITQGSKAMYGSMHYCGRPLLIGTRWCDRHQR